MGSVESTEDNGHIFFPATNTCSKNNGGCSHLCLPSGVSKVTCHCPGEMSLGVDEKICRREL